MRSNTAAFSAASHHGSDSALIDNHGRPITYLRLAITDRCNLRCSYCMPEQGVATISHDEMLSYEELERLVRLFLGMGVKKVRITGGEPFVRRGCIDFLERLKQEFRVKELVVTTNGVETSRYLKRLKALPISGINLSLDTIDRQRFKEITRRDRLSQVLDTLYGALDHGISLKVNSVVTEQTTDDDIRRLGLLVKEHDFSLRFIEKMPFSGVHDAAAAIDYRLQQRLEALFPDLQERKLEEVSTARLFTVPGFAGSLGIIEGSSRKFCSACNKIRITPQGVLKACLYDSGVLDLKRLLRNGVADGDIAAQIRSCLKHRFADGHATQAANGFGAQTEQPSMASIGG
jgi:cyclic pyranopterin phosphate synthase